MSSLKIKASLLGTLSVLLLSACESPFQGQQILPPLDHFPMPNKDQIALVDGRPLTLTDFLAIRDRLKTASSEQALWVGIATIALQNEARSRGKDIPLRNTYDVARYAVGDILTAEAQTSLNTYYSGGVHPPADEVKKQIDAITKKSVVLRNSQPLSLIH